MTHMTITQDEMQRMPWTAHLMKEDELQRWTASRKEAGLAIDIETCELGAWYACDFDHYGVNPELPEELRQVGKHRFVRSPETRGWVCEHDLPAYKVRAMYARIEREFAAHPDDWRVRACRGLTLTLHSPSREP